MKGASQMLPIRAHQFVICALMAISVTAARAADASGWDGDQHAKVRLLAGTPIDGPSGKIWRAGIEIKLAPGWKTYWRYPGEAGVPPRFDFAGSENVKTVTVLWPAPRRISEDGITLIGYNEDVILPLHITPQDQGKAVKLQLKLDYGICERLCILAEAKVELDLLGGEFFHDGALTAAEARVPRTVALGQGEALAIRAIHRDNRSNRPHVIVDVAAPDGLHVDLFAEGPTPEWALPLPEPVAAPAGLQRFAFDLDGGPPNSKPDSLMLKLTAVADDEAIEVSFHIDKVQR